MVRPDILNLPVIADKLAKLQASHIETENLMDKWHAESKQAQEADHGKARRKSRHKGRRKQKNIPVKARERAREASGGNGDQYEPGTQADAERAVHSGEEEEVAKWASGFKDMSVSELETILSHGLSNLCLPEDHPKILAIRKLIDAF